jgi:hypothetical protein
MFDLLLLDYNQYPMENIEKNLFNYFLFFTLTFNVIDEIIDVSVI